ncbi:MAG: PfkB family carbohydrate kinase [Pseudomonadota bacterium]
MVLNARKFLVIGRVGMDLCPDPPGTATQDAETMMAAMGGSAANTAAGLVKLGCAADLVTTVSSDGVGQFCLAQLDNYGVGRQYVRTTTGQARTSLAIYESRLADHQTVIYRNNAADFLMDHSDVAAIDFAAYDAVITAGTVFAADPSRTAAFAALDMAKVAGKPIIFDVDYRPYSWPSAKVAEDVLSQAAHLSDVIVGNGEEFGFMAGGIEKGQACAHQLSQTTAQCVVYKMGPLGAVTFAGSDVLKTGIYTVDALKPTGAGDSFMAGFLASLADGHGLEQSVLRGSACAAITVSKPACAPAMPYPDDLDAFLASHPGPSDGPE